MEDKAMWLKIYIFTILMIIFLTLLWYWRELQREKSKIANRAKLDKKEPLFARIEIQEKMEETAEAANDFDEKNAAVANNDQVLPQEVVQLEIRAYPDQPYMGYELLQALLAAGFRYGEMNVFNRYDEEGKRVLFSLGVSSPTHSFELSTMGGFSCSGLVMYMSLDGSGSGLLRVFDLMLDTATQLIEDLGGELLDEKQNPVNEEIIAEWQGRIRASEGK